MIAPRTVTSSLIFHQGRPRLGFFLENGGTEDERQGRRRPSVRRDFPVGITDRMAKSGVTDRETNQPRPRCADLGIRGYRERRRSTICSFSIFYPFTGLFMKRRVLIEEERCSRFKLSFESGDEK